MTTIAHWLRTQVSPQSSQKERASLSLGSLLAYPFTLNRKHVANLVVHHLSPLRVKIVTDSEHDLGIKYSDFSGINSVLLSSDVDVVIFDDARMLATISPALNFSAVKPQVLVLTTWGDTPKYVDTIRALMPGLRSLALDVLTDSHPIQWKVVTVPMSQDQVPYYDTVRRAETSGALVNKNLPYPASRMVTMYNYPFDHPVDLSGAICSAEIPPQPDLIDHPQTWIQSGYLPTLEYDGPKLAAIMDSVSSHWPRKQIIMTQFTHRYGVDLITSFLKLSIRDRKSPYQESELFPVECSDDYESYRANFTAFDAAESGILITNVVPPVALHHIGAMHIVDSYQYTPVLLTLSKIHQRHVTNNGIVLYLYVATHPHEPSADQVLSDEFIKRIKDADSYFARLVDSSNKIVFTPGVGLVVK